MKVHLLTIGDELLIGQVIDTNSAWMAQQLNLIGASIVQITSISDEQDHINSALDDALATADVVLMTGGLGPTKDDITKKTLANYFGTSMEFHQPTYDRILRLFERWGRSPTPAHKEQCYMPKNALLLRNKMGTAPGMWFDWNGKVVVSMPGVPYEMKYLMEHEVLPKLNDTFPSQPIAHRTILTVGEGESRIAARIEDIETALPNNLKLAFLPNLGKVRLRLSGTGPNQQELETLLDEKMKDIEGRIPELIFGHDKELLEAVIGEMLKTKGLHLGTAESCTGGYIAHQITTVPGSSAYFKGSIIAYSNAIKEKMLGVSSATLTEHGAVSEATVKEMVAGALKALDVDIAVSISGIAGPGGGTPEKPVGTTWIAVGNNETIEAQKISAGKDRLKNIQYVSVHALNLIRKFIQKNYA